ncbi:hypothetical protein GCM10008171_10970 [Methylopila jiangsuensis]|uniref:Alpha/beta hydrolase n=1 Tax=Methylopila jiangsuensis TaxID=586230 RepID=A0A9W6JGI5_9HYPH|nr:hypothetical protein [Methylopila jiangsuensis]MDR6286085.1 tetratricopeptide (TPR) repeat protein [Methylopila jiangsuensis]GLK75843.1 hypothetical protein GCM10008171_10970 [Methylopila jiangsuensis]
MSAEERRELYRGKDVVVVERLAPGSADVAVTFTPFSDRSRRVGGYAETFLAGRGVSAVHVISQRNHWWQTPEMEPALEAIRALKLRARHRHVTTYGSSMGGHGALLFARAVGADQALALSPQFAVNGRGAEWRRRWPTLPELYRYEDTASPNIRVAVAYDPYDGFDRRHAEAIRAVTPFEAVRVPFSLHPVGPALVEMDLLSGFAQAFLAGGGDMAALNAEIRSRRRSSFVCLSGLLHRLDRRSAKGTMRRQVQKRVSDMFEKRLKAGAPMELKLAFRSVVKPYFDRLEARGDRKAALRMARRLLQLNPSSYEAHALLARQLGRAGEHGEALSVLAAGYRFNRRVQTAVAVADAAFAAAQPEEAHRFLKIAFGLPQTEAGPWVNLILAHGGAMDHRYAKRAFRLAAEIAPDHPRLEEARLRASRAEAA